MEVFKKDMPHKAHKKMIKREETNILEAINFDMSVDHPYKYFVKHVMKMKDVPVEVCSAAIEFIARAAFHLSYKFLKLKLPLPLPFQDEEEGYCEFFQMTLGRYFKSDDGIV